MTSQLSLRRRYRLRWTRRHMLWRAFRARHNLQVVTVKTSAIARAPILAFACVRNEAMRLPYFLEHHRKLGVGHFLIVSNASTDDTEDLLKSEPDVSLWRTQAGYKDARFGMDWLGWLHRRFGSSKWCLTADADELLIYPDWENRDLHRLTTWMDGRGQRSFGTMMLDLYPKGSPDTFSYEPGQDPTRVLEWFDDRGYWCERRGRHQSVCLIGGVRARCFFEGAPDKAPVLNKVPLIKWRKSYAYLSSTHVALPPRLNRYHTEAGREKPCGVLLHTKFLPGVSARAREDKARGQQYTNGPAHDRYYDQLGNAPDLWTPQSARFDGWEQLVRLGLMWPGEW